MTQISPKNTDTMPTPAYTPTQLQSLFLASDYAQEVWQKYQPHAEDLLATYPLEHTLSKAAITSLCPMPFEDMAALTWAEKEVAFQKRVRRFRHLMMLRWIWQDALGLISVPQLTQELSWFADICLKTAKTFAYEQLICRYGKPFGKAQKPQDLIIVAMGKMGANELNLSSDIDLVFLYDSDGVTDGDKQGLKTIETKRFMMMWGQKIIKLLDAVTPEGFVFRIDMRLRPWGDGSDLAINLNALKIYFQKHGRAWERFAWLKARAVTGQEKDIAKLNTLIQQFVFRYYVDYTAFSALREMKSMIMHQQRQRGAEDDIKLGAGGIRDIEFVVQAHQLIQGGRKPELQVPQCLQALQALANSGIVAQPVQVDLAAAYLFLRRVEHALQAVADKQTQKLPTAAPAQARLAKVLGFADWQAFLTVLNQHRHTVSAQFHQLVADRETADDAQISHDEAQEIVASRLSEAEQQVLANFLSSSTVAKLTHQAKERLEALWPELIKAIAHAKNPSVAAQRILRFVEAVLNRSIYLVLLKENPDGTAHLVRMMTASPWIASELTRYPVLLDEFLLNRKKALPHKTELTDRLRQQLLRIEPNDEEAQITAIRLFKKSEVLHVAAKDILTNKALMQVSDGLTWTAEAVLTQALTLTYQTLTKAHGFPVLLCEQAGTVRANAADTGFGIIGYGKLGGIELSYGSDLDLVFLHRIDEAAETDGARPISGLKFVSRLAKKLITMLSTQTRDGRAYEIDMRLRPSGAAGVMVSSLAAFESYQKNKAWLWEHQALVRARAICGDATVAKKFTQIRHETLCQTRDVAETQAEVKKMRQKMREHLASSAKDIAQGLFSLKHDTGGIVDIEFLAQYAVLVSSQTHDSVTEYPDNVRIFERLIKVGFMPAADANALTEHYLALRHATHRQALAENSTQVPAQHWQFVRDEVMALWQKYLGESQVSSET